VYEQVTKRNAYVTANMGELKQESGQLKTGFESQEATMTNRNATERIRKLVHDPSLRKVEISIVRNRNQIEDGNSSIFIDAFPESSPEGERNLSSTI
jgi:hypothetical protein